MTKIWKNIIQDLMMKKWASKLVWKDEESNKKDGKTS